MTFPPVPGADGFLYGLRLQATTGLDGYTLINGTATILTWTVPDDGNMHRVALFSSMLVSVTEVGGQIEFGFTDPGGTARDRNVYPAAQTAAYYTQSGDTPQLFNVAPGSVCTLIQNQALTGGAAIMYAEIWGS